MTALKQRIKRLIAANGPISVADYMALCLFDPEDGYYTNREPFGVAGDFTTAPEISQMFGELVAVWLHTAWQATGRPLPVTIAEIGPGRGTLMKDILRTLLKLDPSLVAQASFAMIETSPRLVEIQKKTLTGTQARIDWHQSIETLPANPLIIVGNELFDAIPIRQFVRTSGKWRERMVGLSEAGELHFLAGAASLDPSLLPGNAATASDGAIAELAPARTALMDAIADRIATHGGAGLFIDYGHLEPGIGDTLQALRKHQYEDVLASPGHADITSHVDFSALAATARGKRLDAHLMTQGHFLLEMGLLERAGHLGAAMDAAGQEKIRGQVERLAGPSAMGDLFKVLAILPSGTAVSPFPDAD
ncbi:class I SAM-dependent methyltransferase [Mesorhizobium sp. YR577]|uniref:class I SAM-dependent methyltransferase n=1 Tax=Mesorhizobium sp. YR577 TaxID=1884373 RepID=UPI0008EDFB25|nr:class I SAM-dependent methyltransferase [Mesorhizobium sp. YR577]SFU19957.1 SAM-dependent methyltransferase, MidA family [Mesorhizobium sp. YR577]